MYKDQIKADKFPKIKMKHIEDFKNLEYRLVHHFYYYRELQCINPTYPDVCKHFTYVGGKYYIDNVERTYVDWSNILLESICLNFEIKLIRWSDV